MIPRSAQTYLNETMGMSAGGAQARAVTTLGALPLIVLSRGKDIDEELAASQARYLQLSTVSQHLIAEQSDHHIMIEQPEAAIAAIVKMVEQSSPDRLKGIDHNPEFDSSLPDETSPRKW